MCDLIHDDGTLQKVYASLRKMTPLSDQEITDVINDMQNNGILFRERA